METPGFCYSHSSAIHYRWVQESAPEMFQEILRRIREGRWEVVGGWPVEPDCNIPSTESFARHCLYGKRFCRQALQVDVEIGFNPDSFGHGAGLPTILKQAGYKSYVFMRPQEHEMELPRLFWWEGPDGSRVLAYRIYGDYDRNPERIREAAAASMPNGMKHGAFFMGVGDHGGAVTKAYIQKVLSMQSDPSLPELRWSTLREFFGAVTGSAAFGAIPVVRGDLQHHARGCYSANGEQKLQNRRAEHEMFRAESIAVVASTAYGRTGPGVYPGVYPGARFAEAWGKVLFNQFHDILAGTSLFSDYVDARDGIGLACEMAQESKVENLLRMAKRVDLGDVEEGAVFAWNPLPWRRRALLEFHVAAAHAPAEGPKSLRSQDGGRTALQMRPSDSMTNFYPRVSAWVDLPPCGYKVFTIEREAAAEAPAFPRRAVVATDRFGFGSLRADDGTEMLAGPIGLVVIEDKSDTWAHGIAAFRKELGRPTFVSAEVIEDGPVTRVTRQRMEWRSSKIAVDIAEFSATGAIELRFVIDWGEHEQILKLEVPSRLVGPKVFAKVPGAVLERAANGDEEPYQDWVCVEGTVGAGTVGSGTGGSGTSGSGTVGAGTYTLGLINRSTYSYDCMGGLLRTILIRSAPYARHDPNKVETGGTNAWQDQGRQERTFWMVAGTGAHAGMALDRRAIELETPAEYVLDSRHQGTEARERSFLEVMPETIEVLALKGAEVGSEVVLRMQERAGRETTARIRWAASGAVHEVQLRAWEIKTIAMPRGGKGGVRAVSILEA